jgi:hypothetical protein
VEIVINALLNSGSDEMNESEAIEFFTGALAIEKELNVEVSHETHRGRILHSPFAFFRTIKALPELKITLDVFTISYYALDLLTKLIFKISHWVVVLERVLDMDKLFLVIKQTRHIHARIGTSQHAQISNPSEPASKAESKFIDFHQNVWAACFQACSEDKRAFFSFTPEYGPLEDLYMPHSLLRNGEWTSPEEGWLDRLINGERKRLSEKLFL